MNQSMLQAELTSLKKLREERMIRSLKKSTDQMLRVTTIIDEHWLILPDELRGIISDFVAAMREYVEKPGGYTLQQRFGAFVYLAKELLNEERPIFAFTSSYAKMRVAFDHAQQNDAAIWEAIQERSKSEEAISARAESQLEFDNGGGTVYTADTFKSRFLSA